MNVNISHCYPIEIAEEMNRLVEEHVFPSKNAIVREGIKKVLEEHKDQKTEVRSK